MVVEVVVGAIVVVVGFMVGTVSTFETTEVPTLSTALGDPLELEQPTATHKAIANTHRMLQAYDATLERACAAWDRKVGTSRIELDQLTAT